VNRGPGTVNAYQCAVFGHPSKIVGRKEGCVSGLDQTSFVLCLANVDGSLM
jgi:hypothetical protein